MTDTRETLREAVAKLVFDAPDFGAHIPGKPRWVPKGNSIMQDRARGTADAILATMFERLNVLPTNWELSWGAVSDDEGAPCAWRIHRRSGNRSDREWTQLAIGETPTQAMLAAFQQENSDGQ